MTSNLLKAWHEGRKDARADIEEFGYWFSSDIPASNLDEDARPFYEACTNDNEQDDLIVTAETEADATDMKSWGLDEELWAYALGAAYESLGARKDPRYA